MSNGALRLLAGAGAVDDPVYVDDVFSTFLYDGTGSSQTINNGIDLSGEGGLVWIKRRSTTRGHGLFDTERGVNQRLYSHLDLASGTNTSSLTAFNSNGFTVGTESDVNGSSETNVAWTFRKAEKFFDIVTYTGDGTTSRSISHNLGVTPGFVIIKRTDNTSNWTCWVRNSNGTQAITAFSLNATTASGVVFSDYWMTGMSSTAINLASVADTGSGNSHNVNGGTYVAYLFAHNDSDGEYGEDSDEDIIKCGTYSGNGSSTGPTVNLGFEPQFLLIKSVSSGDAWGLFDSMRGIFTGGNDAYLQAQASDVEYDNADWMDLTATGFQLKNSHDFVNGSSNTYMYMAIRRPHKPASEFAATDLFQPKKLTTTGFTEYTGVGFPVDLAIQKSPDSTDHWDVVDRLRGPSKYIQFSSADAEGTDVANELGGFDLMDGVKMGTASNGQFNGYNPNLHYYFRRAPGFFDIVLYEGDSSSGTKTINHNLGAVPELMIVKNRDASYNWWTAHTFTASNAMLHYPGPNGVSAQTESYGTSLGLNAQPTSTSFVVNTDTLIGRARNYVAYLFATVDGISKIGSYTGTGSDVTVDCGFSAGARFILIKRTDDTTSGQHWYVLDSVRGITTGNDGALQLNEPNSEDSRGWVKPDNSGFIASDQYRTTISGAEYLFFAIA